MLFYSMGNNGYYAHACIIDVAYIAQVIICEIMYAKLVYIIHELSCTPAHGDLLNNSKILQISTKSLCSSQCDGLPISGL